MSVEFITEPVYSITLKLLPWTLFFQVGQNHTMLHVLAKEGENELNSKDV